MTKKAVKKVKKRAVKKPSKKKTVRKVSKPKAKVKRAVKKPVRKRVVKKSVKRKVSTSVFKKVTSIKKLQSLATEIREDLIRELAEAGSGHSAGPLGMADIFTALYFNVLHHNPKNPWWKDRDRFILSNGHICPIWYVALAWAGYFPKTELRTLRKLGTRLQGHPHIHSAPGIENTGGPLAQGISFAVGVALGGKMDNKKYRVYCGMGDGELQEGQCWEAFMFAGNNKLDNLVAIIDRNHIQIDGRTEDVMPLDPLDKKFEAFNWKVFEINGNNMKQVVSTFEKAKQVKGKPVVIIAHNVPGKGVFYMEDKYQWHGKPPSKDEAKIALQELVKEDFKLRGIKKKDVESIMKEVTLYS